MLGLNSALDQIINFPIETEEDNKSSAHEFVMLNDSLVIVSAPPTIKDNYDPNNTPEPNNDSKLVAGTSASVISTYVKVRTLRDEWEDLIQLLKKYYDLKFVINTIYEAQRPGKIIKTLFSIGIVQMTVTSVLYNPILAAGFSAYLGYVFFNDSKEKGYKDTKVTLGVGALIFNNISPFIFDPAVNPFLFMTYFYFSMSAWGVLTSSFEKTKLLSKITYLTGANAFVIESPFVYLGFLTLLEKGYIDDIIGKKAPALLVNSILATVKSSAKEAVTEYLCTVTEVLKDSFQTVILLPVQIVKDMLNSRFISNEFVDLKKGR